MDTPAPRPHHPVLLEEVMELLAPAPGQRILDATLGAGGHAEALAKAIAPGGLLIGTDRDASALALARDRLSSAPVPVEFRQASFRHVEEVLDKLNLETVDRILTDLGLSSMQVDNPARGFSFRADAPLDMRMDPDSGSPTAADLVNTLSGEEIADILWTFGEERFSRRIAKSLVAERSKKTIDTTGRLASIVRKCVPGRSRIDKATRVFQALRMAVNDEAGELTHALERWPGRLAPGGRWAVISFHSLEDRMVKNAFRFLAAEGGYRILTRKPVTAGRGERERNPRSRSAKLRAIERVS